jgi:hypothetical protein
VTFDLPKMIESKRAYRDKLATLPIAKKLRILDALRERELAIRGIQPSSRARRTRPSSPFLAMKNYPVLAPFADSVSERFDEWLRDKAKAGTVFAQEQLAWLNLMRDQIATSITIERDDLDLAPFNQRGGLGKAHELFGEQLSMLLDELNEALAA